MARARPAAGGKSSTGSDAVLMFRNRTVTVMRGIEVNDAGDISDVGTALYTGVQAAIAEVSHDTFDPASSTRRTIREVQCVLPAWTDVLLTDTLKDEANGYYYRIQEIVQRPSAGYYPPDLLLTLSEVTGLGVASGPAPPAPSD
jgi:hypothetical protein